MVLINSFSFLFAALLVLVISVPSKPIAGDRHSDGVEAVETARGSWTAFWREWVEGIQIIKRNRLVTMIFVVVAIAIFGDNVLTALMVPFIQEVLQGSALGFGWLLAARGVGGLIGGVIVGQWGGIINPNRLLVLSLIAVGSILLVMFNFASLSSAVFLFGLQGIPFVAFMASHQSLLQSNVPDKYLGRVFGTFGTTVALLGLGGLGVGGMLGDALGIVPVLNISGILFILAGTVALLLGRTQAEITSTQ